MKRLGLVFVVAIALVGCSSDDKKTSSSATTTTVSTATTAGGEGNDIKTTVEAFYKGYNDILVTGFATISTVSQPPSENPSDKALAYAKASPDVTDQFKASLDGPRDADPVICAQDISEKPITAETPTISGDTATVAVHQEFGSGRSNIKVTLKKVGGAWKIDAVECLP